MFTDNDPNSRRGPESETPSLTEPDVTRKLNARALEKAEVTPGECTGDSLEQILESAYYPH